MTPVHRIPEVKKLITAALREDLGSGDATTIACIPKNARGEGRIISKATGILCGVDIAAQIFRALDPKCKIRIQVHDGNAIKPGLEIMHVNGSLRALLAAERTALNFLQQLSGVASYTRLFVDAIKGTHATILDTRKTTPLLRTLEKYAVRTGGGENHRFGLSDMILIKDNHIAAAGSIAAAVKQCITFKRQSKLKVEVETSTIEQVRDILEIGGVDRIMLDNYSLPQIRAAVKLVAHRVPLEASGGVSLKTVRAIAMTGVEFISLGAITHSAPAVDLSFEILCG